MPSQINNNTTTYRLSYKDPAPTKKIIRRKKSLKRNSKDASVSSRNGNDLGQVQVAHSHVSTADRKGGSASKCNHDTGCGARVAGPARLEDSVVEVMDPYSTVGHQPSTVGVPPNVYAVHVDTTYNSTRPHVSSYDIISGAPLASAASFVSKAGKRTDDNVSKLLIEGSEA
ncbi:hypothetical protein HDU85_001068 [Gaertneriomyces sp. JEL0708]|nr:hypothetical protein HDU85_001068 [Gaertneriomyces sp. JEL0708]